MISSFALEWYANGGVLAYDVSIYSITFNFGIHYMRTFHAVAIMRIHSGWSNGKYSPSFLLLFGIGNKVLVQVEFAFQTSHSTYYFKSNFKIRMKKGVWLIHHVKELKITQWYLILQIHSNWDHFELYIHFFIWNNWGELKSRLIHTEEAFNKRQNTCVSICSSIYFRYLFLIVVHFYLFIVRYASNYPWIFILISDEFQLWIFICVNEQCFNVNVFNFLYRFSKKEYRTSNNWCFQIPQLFTSSFLMIRLNFDILQNTITFNSWL